MKSVVADMERWPLIEPFSISRYTFDVSLIATLTLEDAAGHVGRGECEPHEWDGTIAAQMLAGAGLQPGARCAPGWLAGLTRDNLGSRLPRSPLRNAIDCALWDLEAKQTGVRAHVRAGLPLLPLPVMPTLSIDTPAAMAAAAAVFRGAPWLKVKVGRADGLDAERLEAVAAAVPSTALLVDANGGWTPHDLPRLLPLAQRLGVRLIEQPMLPELDAQLPVPPGDVLFCADESCLDRSSLPAVAGSYQTINIKLDKTGGLTEALALRQAAEQLGLGVMVGMMSGTSLAVAPAAVLAQGLEVVDLEVGFLTRDRAHPMHVDNYRLLPPSPDLWG